MQLRSPRRTGPKQLILVIRQQHLFLLKRAVGAVVAMVDIIVVASEVAVEPVFVEVFEIEAHTSLGKVADVES